MENNIKDMRARHKAEIEALQSQCDHKETKTTVSPFEKHIICVTCGKMIERQR